MKVRLAAGATVVAIACFASALCAVVDVHDQQRGSAIATQVVGNVHQAMDAPEVATVSESPVVVEDAYVEFVDHVSGEDTLTIEWDQLPPRRRVAELRRQFDEAVQLVRSGRDVPTARAQADAALSGLRAELYPTASGRARHEKLERRLESAMERASTKTERPQ